jgi:hypothetical protein
MLLAARLLPSPDCCPRQTAALKHNTHNSQQLVQSAAGSCSAAAPSPAHQQKRAGNRMVFLNITPQYQISHKQATPQVPLTCTSAVLQLLLSCATAASSTSATAPGPACSGSRTNSASPGSSGWPVAGSVGAAARRPARSEAGSQGLRSQVVMEGGWPGGREKLYYVVTYSAGGRVAKGLSCGVGSKLLYANTQVVI